MKPYKKYKNSGVPWIGEIPKDWGVNKTKYIFDFRKGLPITKANLEDNGISVISYGQVHSKDNTETYIQDSFIRFVNEKYLQSNPNSLTMKGDFIFADTSEDLDGCGNCVYVDRNIELFAGYHTIIMSSKKTDDNRFYAYLYTTNEWRKQIREQVSGVKLFSITQKMLKDTSVLIPPLDTQHRIADYLDRKTAAIDTLIADKQKMIELLKERRQAIISEAVTKGLDKNVKMKDSGIEWIGEIPKDWKVEKIKYLVQEPLMYGANETAELEDDTLPRYIRITDIDDKGALKQDTFKSLTIDKASPYLLNKGDILLARSGASVGKSYLHNTNNPACFAGYLIKLSPDINKVDNKFVYYNTLTDVYENWIKINTIQATIQNVSAEKYNNFEIAYPDSVEQSRIVDYLDCKTAQIDNLMTDITIQIEKLKEYRQAIISEAVTGKVEI